MTDATMRREPGRGEKCHATAVNVPGWLTVRTYAMCGAAPCVVDGSGDTHRVIVANDSPLGYDIEVSGRCVTGGIAYQCDGGQRSEWTPEPFTLYGRKKRGKGSTKQLDGQLVALRKRDDEFIEISVSWSCVTYFGKGSIEAPLTIQVDARPAS